MSMLSDLLIQQAISLGDIEVEPYDHHMVQPASIDLRLGHDFLVYKGPAPVDPHLDNSANFQRIIVPAESEFILYKGDFALACTMERVWLSPKYSGRIEGKSSLARNGLIVHSTAGFVDPGFRGRLTLEMSALMCDVILRPGMLVAQLSFTTMLEPPMYAYGHEYLGSHYQHQAGATAAAPLPPNR